MKGFSLVAAALFMAVAALALYRPSLSGPFLYDDLSVVTDRGPVYSGDLFRDLAEIWKSRRSVSVATFAANHALHGYDTLGYHLVNVAVHALAGFFLFLFLRATLLFPTEKTRKDSAAWAAFLGALLWLAHPLATQSVSYVIQRMNALAALFFLACLFFYAQARLAGPGRGKTIRFAVSGACGLLALGSKENAATLP
ncbi:MAG: hypothetical protein JRJ59_08210, partial [Deltaproteobacteria bacterium]|nr:hypothetical protein [Deltaproteobacteria bacterium]